MAYINKWVTLVACIPVMLGSGAPYTFSVWSDSLKEAYGMSQTQLATVGSIGGFGAFFGVVAGLVYDKLEGFPRLGPRLTLVIGGVTNLMGNLALWAAIQRVFVARYWQLPLLVFLSSSGMTWFDSSSLATNVHNFPAHRGLAIGLLKSALGLSGSFFTTLYMWLLQPRGGPPAFLLLMGLAPSAMAFCAALVANRVPFVQQSEVHHEEGEGRRPSGWWGRLITEGRFLLAIQAMGTLALYLMAVAIMNCMNPTTPAVQRWFAVRAVLLLLPLLLVLLGSGGLLAKPAHLHGSDDEGAKSPRRSLQRVGGTEEPLLARDRLDARSEDLPETSSGSGGNSVKEAAGATVRAGKPPPPAPNLSPLQCLPTIDFWLLFVACCLGNGAGLVLNNNLAQLVRALGGPQGGQDVLVSLFGVGNCGGRLLMGYFSEKALHAAGVPRPLFLVGACAVTALLCLLLACGGLRALYPLCPAMGLVFGAYWSLMPSLASELFGLQHFATNYTLFQLSPAFSSTVIGSYMAGALYDRAARRHGTGRNTCLGEDCFRPTFLIMAGLCVVGIACAVKLYLRTRELYRRVTYTAVHQHDLDMDEAE